MLRLPFRTVANILPLMVAWTMIVLVSCDTPGKLLPQDDFHASIQIGIEKLGEVKQLGLSADVDKTVSEYGKILDELNGDLRASLQAADNAYNRAVKQRGTSESERRHYYDSQQRTIRQAQALTAQVRMVNSTIGEVLEKGGSADSLQALTEEMRKLLEAANRDGLTSLTPARVDQKSTGANSPNILVVTDEPAYVTVTYYLATRKGIPRFVADSIQRQLERAKDQGAPDPPTLPKDQMLAALVWVRCMPDEESRRSDNFLLAAGESSEVVWKIHVPVEDVGAIRFGVNHDLLIGDRNLVDYVRDGKLTDGNFGMHGENVYIGRVAFDRGGQQELWKTYPKGFWIAAYKDEQ